jgi:molybdate transport system substrate-binding protein
MRAFVKHAFSLAAAGVLLLGAPPCVFAQTDVTVLVPNPFRRSLDKLVPDFERATGHTVAVTYGKGMGTRQQVVDGETFDVFIVLAPYPDVLASGNVDPDSETLLASLTLALGVKKGAPKPDISTPEALRQTLLAADTIAYVDPTIGSDGFATRNALQTLGVIDLIQSKSTFGPFARVTGDLVATGKAELCMFYLNEMASPDLDVVGRLPKEVAPPVQVVAFVSTDARNASAARSLVDYLSSAEADASYEEDGLEPAR